MLGAERGSMVQLQRVQLTFEGFFRLLEPSLGSGDFVLPAVERLLAAAQREPGGLCFERLAPAIRGIELHRQTFARTHQALLDVWLRQGDFLRA